MTKPEPEHYEWAIDHSVTSYAEAGCLTLVVGLSSDEALAKVGADLDQPTPVEEADPATGLSWVSVAEVDPGHDAGSACLVVEDNDYQGTRPEVLAALSKRGKAATVFWNVEGMVTFGCARRGKILVTGELTDVDESGDLPRSLAPLARRADDDESNLVAIALAMAVKFTGVPVPRTPDSSTPSVAFPVTKPLLGLRVTPEELIGLQLPSEELVRAVQAATPEARRRLAHWAARLAVEQAGVAHETGAVAMLEQFGQPQFTRITPAAANLRRTADRWCDAATYALGVEGDEEKWLSLRHWTRISWAMEALAYTASDDEVTAALGATYCASIPLGDRKHEFLAEALATLQG